MVHFKQRVLDCFKQKWQADLNNNSVLNTLYIHLKTDLNFENYLNTIKSKYLRSSITRLRISSHNLRIQTGRYGRNRIDRQERLCQVCQCSEIEDEYHFILICSVYHELRIRLIKRYFYHRPSMYKFIEMLKSNNKSVLNNLSKFIYLANKKRNDLLNSYPRL